MTCGSVDDGKSTLLGRLIYETDNLLEDQSDYLSKLNQKFAKKGRFLVPRSPLEICFRGPNRDGFVSFEKVFSCRSDVVALPA